jgi:hypothetical protein
MGAVPVPAFAGGSYLRRRRWGFFPSESLAALGHPRDPPRRLKVSRDNAHSGVARRWRP